MDRLYWIRAHITEFLSADVQKQECPRKFRSPELSSAPVDDLRTRLGHVWSTRPPTTAWSSFSRTCLPADLASDQQSCNLCRGPRLFQSQCAICDTKYALVCYLALATHVVAMALGGIVWRLWESCQKHQAQPRARRGRREGAESGP